MIVVGDSLGKLEQALQSGLVQSTRLVLELSGVDRIDSTGMGLLVRFLTHVRNQGGDLRLASPTGFVRKLLSATRLDTVFLVYTSEYNAIASFFVRGVPGKRPGEFAATILFLDQSDDLCAFARSVLGQHGYEVLTASRLPDALLIAEAAQPSVILIGPRMPELESEAAVPALQACAPDALTVTLPADLAGSHPHHAAAALLKAVKQQKPAPSASPETR